MQKILKYTLCPMCKGGPMTFMTLPADPAHDALLCYNGKCAYWTLTNKGQMP